MTQALHPGLQTIHRTWRIVGLSLAFGVIVLASLAVVLLAGLISVGDAKLIAYVLLAVAALDLIPTYFCLAMVPARLEEATRIVQRAVFR